MVLKLVLTMLRTYIDEAVQYFPSSQIKFGGELTGKYQYVKGPKNFHLKAEIREVN
jgi:hypothetical protein